LVTLGIDSSDEYLSVGLSSGEKIILSRSNEPRAQNKNALHAFMLSVMEEAGYRIDGLNGVAIAIGPGSFTGLRVGLAVAKGICWATGLPLAGVSSLMAIAQAATIETNRILAVKDARRDEFYYAGFIREDDGFAQTIPDSVGGAEEVIAHAAGGYALVGPGLVALSRYPGSPQAISGLGYDRDLIGGVVARLGAGQLTAGKTLDLATAIPNYIRVPKPREWKP
jgi:tRNA threonylcarbamoyladenosine biosynthesis protein TsaB